MREIVENGFASIMIWKSYFRSTADSTLSEKSVNLCSYYVNGLVFLFWHLMLQFMQKHPWDFVEIIHLQQQL